MKELSESRLKEWTQEMKDAKFNPLGYSDNFSNIGCAIRRYSMKDVDEKVIESFLKTASDLSQAIQRRVEIVTQKHLVEEYKKNQFEIWINAYSQILDYFGEAYSLYKIDLYNLQIAVYRSDLVFNSSDKKAEHRMINKLSHIESSIYAELYLTSPRDAIYVSWIFVLIDVYLIMGEINKDLHFQKDAINSYTMCINASRLLPDSELRYDVLQKIYTCMKEISLIFIELDSKKALFMHHFTKKFKYDIENGKSYVPTCFI